MRQLPFDSVRIPLAHFVQPNRGHSPEAVSRGFVLAVAEAAERGIKCVLRDWTSACPYRGEEEPASASMLMEIS